MAPQAVNQTAPIDILQAMQGNIKQYLQETVADSTVRTKWRRLGDDLTGFVLSAAMTLITVNLLKRWVGRPRPCFYSLQAYANLSAPDDFLAWEAKSRASFPSGHAGWSFCGLTFLALRLASETGRVAAWIGERYLQQDSESMRGSLSEACAQALWFGWFLLCITPFGLAIWVACTRIREFWHFYSDVVAGSLIGMLSSVVAYRFCQMLLTRDGSVLPYDGLHYAKEV